MIGQVSGFVASAFAPRRNVGRLLGLAWLHFLNDGTTNYLPGVLPALLLSLHQRPALASVMMGALLIGQAIQPGFGLLADRLGGRSLIALGLAGSSLGGAVLGLVPTLWLLIVVLLLMGLASSAFHPQALAGARRLGGPQHGLAISVFLVGGEIGRGVWPLLASLVVIHWGMHRLWVLAVAGFFSLAFLYRGLPRLTPRSSAVRINWRRHLKPTALLVTFAGLRAFTFAGLATYLPIAWHAHGGSLVGGASLVTVLLVVGIVGNIGGGALSDRMDRRALLVASSTLVVVFLVLYLLSPNVWRWVLLAMLGIAFFAGLPITIVIGQEIFSENPSLGSGIALGFANGAGAVLLLGLGAVVDRFGVDAALWTLVLATAVATPLALAVPARREVNR